MHLNVVIAIVAQSCVIQSFPPNVIKGIKMNQEVVLKIIQSFSEDSEQISTKSNLRNDLNIDSLGALMIMNELDDELIISTETNYIQVYKIADSVRSHHIKFNESINYIRKDYKTKKLFVSC